MIDYYLDNQSKKEVTSGHSTVTTHSPKHLSTVIQSHLFKIALYLGTLILIPPRSELHRYDIHCIDFYYPVRICHASNACGSCKKSSRKIYTAKKKMYIDKTTPACDYYYSYLMQVARNPSATELQMRRYNITRQQQKKHNT